jgi:hypothetical protein
MHVKKEHLSFLACDRDLDHDRDRDHNRDRDRDHGLGSFIYWSSPLLF